MFFVRQFPLGPSETNCYLLALAGKAVIIDPGGEGDIDDVLEHLNREKHEVTHILVTHKHHDHIAGCRRLQQETGAMVFASEKDDCLKGHSLYQGGFGNVPRVGDFECTHLAPGKHVILQQPCFVYETPGHSPGSLSFFFPCTESVFTGDTLMRRRCGRADIQGGDNDTLIASVRERLFNLPDDTEVFPGHGSATTIGEEKRENPHFRDARYDGKKD